MRKYACKFFLIFFIGFSQVQSQPLYLPLDHWAYDFLERMEMREVLTGLRGGSRPFTRERVAGFVTDIDQYTKDHPNELSRTEREILERLKGEFWHELQGKDLSVREKEREPHFYTWNFKTGSVYFDILSGGGSRFRFGEVDSEEKRVYSAFYGGILRGNLWGLAFYSDNRILTEWGSRKYIQHYNPSVGYPIGINSDSSRATWDTSVSYLSFGWKGLRFEFGRDRMQWGPAHCGGLLLSGLAPDFDLFKISTNIGASVFTWVHGELRSDFSHKWFSAHRLELSVGRGIDIGLHELVIYGNRGIEIAYLNPILPYLVAQHSLGDRDNVSLGFDFTVNRVRNLKFYGEFFIDDLFEPWDVFSDFWGNKLALTLGGYWINPLGWANSGIRWEYTRIEPYVYTHDDSVNVYEHYDFGLGHFLQPNSDGLFFLAECQPRLSFKIAFEFRSVRHGEGDRRIPHREEDGTKKIFLKGVVEHQYSAGLFLEWEIIRDLRWRTELSRVWTANYQNVQDDHRAWNEWLFSLYVNW